MDKQFNKVNELISELSSILCQEEIKSNKDITEFLIHCKKQLEEGYPYDLVCTKLTKNINFYLLSHNFKAPDSILNLYNKIKNGDLKYKGIMAYILNITNIFSRN